MEESSSNGLMFRGGFSVNKDVVFNYAAYFSALTTNQFLYADRQYGTRVGAFLPKQRVEVGFSFQHKLIDEHANLYGVHFIWQPRQLPLDIRTEFADSNEGRGYWIEPAFKLTSIHKLHSITSKTHQRNTRRIFKIHPHREHRSRIVSAASHCKHGRR